MVQHPNGHDDHHHDHVHTAELDHKFIANVDKKYLVLTGLKGTTNATVALDN
ncbi:MAG: hypothetical protein ACK55Z_31940 [bacterium]